MGRGEEEPCSSERVFDSLWWPIPTRLDFSSSPFSRPTRPGDICRIQSTACRGPSFGQEGRALPRLPGTGTDLDKPDSRAGKKNCPAGNGDGVLQAPSALTKQASTASSLPFVSGPCQEHRTAPARVATGSWELVVCSVLRRHLHSPAPRPAENGQGLGRGMLPSLIHHRSYASPPLRLQQTSHRPRPPSPFPRETRSRLAPALQIHPSAPVLWPTRLSTPCYPTPTRTPTLNHRRAAVITTPLPQLLDHSAARCSACLLQSATG